MATRPLLLYKAAADLATVEGGPHDPGMEGSVAVLENIAGETKDAIRELRASLDEGFDRIDRRCERIEDDAKANLKWLGGALVMALIGFIFVKFGS